MKCLIVLVALLLAGCGAVCQQVRATRCNGQIVETCGANKKWQRAMDCAQVKPIKPGAPSNWTCGKKADAGHTCMPGGVK